MLEPHGGQITAEAYLGKLDARAVLAGALLGEAWRAISLTGRDTGLTLEA